MFGNSGKWPGVSPDVIEAVWMTHSALEICEKHAAHMCGLIDVLNDVISSTLLVIALDLI